MFPLDILLIFQDIYILMQDIIITVTRAEIALRLPAKSNSELSEVLEEAMDRKRKILPTLMGCAIQKGKIDRLTER